MDSPRNIILIQTRSRRRKTSLLMRRLLMNSSRTQRRRKHMIHTDPPHSIKVVVSTRQAPVEGLEATLLQEAIHSADLVAHREGSAPSSTSRIYSAHLVQGRAVQEEVAKGGPLRFKKRYWLAKISKCRQTSPSWTRRRARQKTSS